MELQDLYREVIVDHNRNPRNFGKMPPPHRQAQGFNPLCGDKIKVYVRTDGDRIEDLSYEASGCAISVASASLMTEKLKGLTIEEANALFDRVHHLLTDDEAEADLDYLGKLAALGGVRNFPTRVKCATLSWHALQAALQGDETSVSTEKGDP